MLSGKKAEKSYASSSDPYSYDEWLQRAHRLAGAESVTRPFEENVWVYAAIRAFSHAAASVPLRIWNGDPDDESSELVPESDPLVKLLTERPNPVQSPRQLREAQAVHYRLDGEDVWFLADNAGQPVRGNTAGKIQAPDLIYQVRGRAISRIETDDFGFPAFYVYQGSGGKEIRFPAHAVLHFRDYDPNSPFRGLGSVEAALREIETDFQAQRYQEAALRHGGDPGGWIVRESKLSEASEQAEERQLNDSLANPSNNGRWRMLTGKGVQVMPAKITPRDMEYGALRASNRDAILSALDTPKPVVGLFEEATFSNLEGATLHFWEGVMTYHAGVEDTFNSHLFPRMSDSRAQRYKARFDRDAVEALQEDMGEKLRLAAEIASSDNGVSLVEAAGMVGVEADLSELEHADVAWISAGKRPVEQALAEPEPQGPVGGDESPSGEPSGGDDGEPASGPTSELQGVVALSLAKAERNPDVPEDVFERPGYEGRRGYYAEKAAPLIDRGEKDLQPRILRFISDYEKAQLARLRDFAHAGDKARGFSQFPDLVASLRANTKAIADELDETDIAPLLLVKAEWERRLREASSDAIDAVFVRAANDIIAEIGGLPFGGLGDADVAAFLESQKIRLVEGVTSTLANRVRGALLRGLAGNETVGTLQEIIADLLPDLTKELRKTFATKEDRALTIARTETAHAANGARQQEMVRNGIERVEWVTSGDVFVRGAPGGPYSDAALSHFELDGQTRRIGDEFRPGLRHPSDPNAAVGDVANCRCVARPVVPEE